MIWRSFIKDCSKNVIFFAMKWIQKMFVFIIWWKQRYREETTRTSLRCLASYSHNLVPMAVTWQWLSSDVTLGVEDVSVSLTPFCGAACHILQVTAALFWPRYHRKVKHKSTCKFLQSLSGVIQQSQPRAFSFISSVHLKELRGKKLFFNMLVWC
jgi:hypothetical protein